MSPFFRKLTWLFRRSSKEAEFQEEIQFQLDEEVGGLAARRELGDLALVQEDTRAA